MGIAVPLLSSTEGTSTASGYVDNRVLRRRSIWNPERMGTEDSSYDDIVVGAGHNGLTTAAYLARAGRRVLVLEKADHVGGASVSATPFPGMSARLSRYSYLVSLMPREIIADLDLDIELIRRRYSSYTPLPMDPGRGSSSTTWTTLRRPRRSGGSPAQTSVFPRGSRSIAGCPRSPNGSSRP